MVKHTQTIRQQQPTNCLSVFNHFVGLALKVLTLSMFLQQNNTYRSYDLNHYLFPMFSFDSTPSLSLGVWFFQEWNGRRQKETLGKYNLTLSYLKSKTEKTFGQFKESDLTIFYL